MIRPERGHLPRHVVQLVALLVVIGLVPTSGHSSPSSKIPTSVRKSQTPGPRPRTPKNRRNQFQRPARFTPHVSATGRQCPPPLNSRLLTGCTTQVVLACAQ
ncbi:uncharacterized protein B0T23DRAFT_185311 [Neurospora hispaniola]|uniref:Secreted protein n=1 Tax=Neurospora hispaniola TaxID=588809 RepID=A0AAJ0I3C7_9PEZI|nr:hypothetical protein B0T23DRAFT_185311 [Neurospora hispaniola]